jgi:hypothetical protein
LLPARIIGRTREGKTNSCRILFQGVTHLLKSFNDSLEAFLQIIGMRWERYGGYDFLAATQG